MPCDGGGNGNRFELRGCFSGASAEPPAAVHGLPVTCPIASPVCAGERMGRLLHCVAAAWQRLLRLASSPRPGLKCPRTPTQPAAGALHRHAAAPGRVRLRPLRQGWLGDGAGASRGAGSAAACAGARRRVAGRHGGPRTCHPPPAACWRWVAWTLGGAGSARGHGAWAPHDSADDDA